MKRLSVVVAICISLIACSTAFAESTLTEEAPQDEGEKIRCHLDFNFKSWSVLYKYGKGSGTIACDNGQTQDVELKLHGGGVTFGKSDIVNGHGTFTKVWDIRELYGSYATSDAHAGIYKSAGAQAMTKGNISLAMRGSGKGYDLGFAFGAFKIQPVTPVVTDAEPEVQIIDELKATEKVLIVDDSKTTEVKDTAEVIDIQ